MLAACGLAGAVLGGLLPSWHAALEPAQVKAGLVSYPPDNPVGLYSRALWSLWHEPLALLLELGIDTRTLTIAVSSAVGALSFAALGLLTLGLGGPPWLAVATPFLVLGLNPKHWGFRYPIFLLDEGHTYGMAGLAWAMLCIGLLAAGRFRAAGFGLGLAPAIHTGIALGVGSAAAACAALRWPDARAHARSIAFGGIAGAACTALSLGAHLLLGGSLPGRASEQTRLHLDAYLDLWDFHRQPADLFGWPGLVLGCGLALASMRLLRDRADPGAAGRRLAFGMLLCVGAIGAGLTLLAHVLPEGLANALSIPLPARLLNLPLLASVPLTLATLGRSTATRTEQGVLFALVAIAFSGNSAPLAVRVLGIPTVVALTALLAIRRQPEPASRALTVAVAIALGATVLRVAVEGASVVPSRWVALGDPRHQPALAAAARGEGLLAPAPGLMRMQLRTERPVVLDPDALDMLPYAPAGGPEMARILKGVYEIDFFAPPASARHLGAISSVLVRGPWERRSADGWAALRDEFGVTDVIAPRGWQLRLPAVASDARFVLYRVPTRDAVAPGPPAGRAAGGEVPVPAP